MKQHITTSELDKLSDRAIDRLNDWLDKHNYFKRKNGICTYPLLSIGQMIEFLDEHHYWDCQPDGRKYGYRDWVCLFKDSCAGDWFISDPSKLRGKKRYHTGELCDVLWEAVKEVLEHGQF